MSSRCSGSDRPRSEERGAVTAELAIGLPILLAVTVGLVWLLSVGLAQLRVVDAARETARAAARDDDTGKAIALGARVAPPGASVRVGRTGDSVVAEVQAFVRGPGGIFSGWAQVRVHARAVSLDEETG